MLTKPKASPPHSSTRSRTPCSSRKSAPSPLRLEKKPCTKASTAGIAGLGLTLLFVLIYYRFAGIIALLGLSLNILILFGAMAMFGFTFTLPGIAGIILTIGVAVDANVLIYERLREELAAGKSIKAAISCRLRQSLLCDL